MRLRWSHLIRFAPGHTGYATFSEAKGVYKDDRLLAVGDNVHAPGQWVATWNAFRDQWLGRDGHPLEVLVRPRRGQPATQPKPHRVVVWHTELENGVPSLCIPWLAVGGELKATPFRPTCDDITRRIENRTHLRGP